MDTLKERTSKFENRSTEIIKTEVPWGGVGAGGEWKKWTVSTGIR